MNISYYDSISTVFSMGFSVSLYISFDGKSQPEFLIPNYDEAVYYIEQQIFIYNKRINVGGLCFIR
jgi:hypothetical protein